MRHTLRVWRIAAVVTALLLSSAAQAQWVFVGRKAAGKIKTLTQREPTGSPGYSVAEVVVSGDAEKVYATALKAIEASPEARLTHQDPKGRDLEFAARGQVFGLRISQVDAKLVHLLIATTAAVGQPDATASVVDATLRICAEMKVRCERSR